MMMITNHDGENDKREMILSGAKQPVGSQPFTLVSLPDRTDENQVQPTRIRENCLLKLVLVA